jgi:8-oxo-dGTP pyrophosphatase MutT (NUDIX family)
VSEQPKPSGTVVVVRDRAGLEVLLLQRAAREGRPGPWVFPGGKVDTSDRRPGASAESDARRAAVREAHEEAALSLEEAALVPISRWITPSISPRRFDTWFYLCAVDGDHGVRVDGLEIGDHRWLAPRDAIAAHQSDRIQLAPPTFVTIAWLSEFQRSEQALSTWAPRPIPLFEPRVLRCDEGACMLYLGDAGYELRDTRIPGARHRLWARPGAWRYELRLA